MGKRLLITGGGIFSEFDDRVGVGIKYATMGIDYAFLPLGDMGQVHRFQMEFRFSGQSRTVIQAAPPQTAPAVQPAEPVPAPEPAPEPPKKEVEVEFVVPATPGE